MFEHLLKVRYVAIVIVFLAVLHAMAFLVLGAKLAFVAYGHILFGVQTGEARPGLELLHSLDHPFISLVLMVLALGIAKLFRLHPKVDESALPVWLRIDSIGELKVLLLRKDRPDHAADREPAGRWPQPGWSARVVGLLYTAIPAAILLLALSLFFMKKA